MTAFAYAVSAAHFCRTEQSLRNEVTNFVNSFYEQPDKYLKELNYNEVIRRMVMHVERGFELSEKREDNPYILKRSTLVDYLQVTDKEAKQLKTIITDNEKYRRKTDKRRKDGIKPRSEYLSKTSDRKEQAIALKEQGLKTKEIAEKLDVSVRTIQGYLKKRKVCP
jgi:DNA-binding NarL/FixJ family response regulator